MTARWRRALRREPSGETLPLPPVELRAMVAQTEPEFWDNPKGEPIFPYLEPEVYESVLDFGCGAGRNARRLILQDPRPRRYLGVDLNPTMIEWCRDNLTPAAPEFEFRHHDVFHVVTNPVPGKPDFLPMPAEEDAFTLAIASSVFTHLTEPQAERYLAELARVLAPNGVVYSTWFMYEKRDFPALEPLTNAIYASYVDPSAAVIFEKTWIERAARAAGLKITGGFTPAVRGHQWIVLMRPESAGGPAARIPEAAFEPNARW